MNFVNEEIFRRDFHQTMNLNNNNNIKKFFFNHMNYSISCTVVTLEVNLQFWTLHVRILFFPPRFGVPSISLPVQLKKCQNCLSTPEENNSREALQCRSSNVRRTKQKKKKTWRPYNEDNTWHERKRRKKLRGKQRSQASCREKTLSRGRGQSQWKLAAPCLHNKPHPCAPHCGLVTRNWHKGRAGEGLSGIKQPSTERLTLLA